MSHFLSSKTRAFLTAAGFGILLNFFASFWSIIVLGYPFVKIFEILFVSGIILLCFIGSIFVAVIYNVIYESKFSLLGWWLGAIASVVLSFTLIGYNSLCMAFIETLVISSLFFSLALQNYKRYGIAYVRNLINQANIRKDEGDIYGAINYYVKSALTASSHPNAKITRMAIQSYEDLAIELTTLSVLKDNVAEVMTFLANCQKKLNRVNVYKEKTSKVDELLKNLASESNLHQIFDMFMDTKNAKLFIDKLAHMRVVKLSALAAEYKWDEKRLQMLLETAVTNGKIEGFLTTDKKTFMTKDFLREKIYDLVTK